MNDINTMLKCDDRGIFYFGDYLSKDMGGAADPYTTRILDLKARRSDAVAYFSEIMDELVLSLRFQG